MRDTKLRRFKNPPWAIRFPGSVSRAPHWIFAVVVPAWLVILAVYHYLAIGPEAFRAVDPEIAWFELVHALIIGYLPASIAYSLRGARRDLHALRPALRLSDTQFRDRLLALGTFNGAQLFLLVVLLVGLSQASLFGPSPSPTWPEGRPPLGDPRMTWIMLRNGIIAALGAQLVYVDVTVARRFSKIGETWAAIDLLDLSPLAPFARRGLRSVLIWTGLTILTSLLFLVSWARPAARAALVLILSVAAIVLLLPVLGVHRRAREAKGAELERVREALRSERDALLAAREPGAVADPRLSNLIAYERRIESARTWPFDPGTLVRFGLYVTLGVGSWLGGAIVERLLGSALD